MAIAWITQLGYLRQGEPFPIKVLARGDGRSEGDVRLSTAFHPQTNGQMVRVNQILEQYLHYYCSY